MHRRKHGLALEREAESLEREARWAESRDKIVRDRADELRVGNGPRNPF